MVLCLSFFLGMAVLGDGAGIITAGLLGLVLIAAGLAVAYGIGSVVDIVQEKVEMRKVYQEDLDEQEFRDWLFDDEDELEDLLQPDDETDEERP